MKIALVYGGCHDWSIHNRCKAIKKFLPEGYDAEIYVNKAPSPVFNEADIIHINYTGGVHILSDVVKQYKDKIVMTLANERSILKGEVVDASRLQWMLDQVACVTAVSKHLSDLFGYTYIPNGVDLEMFSEPRSRVVGYVGTAKENKNYPLLQTVADQLGYTFKPLIYKRNQIPFKLMPEHYRGLDAIIHPSKTEGCSNVVLEALAMNVPVFVTKTGIWDELEDYVTFIEPTREGIESAFHKMNGRRLIERKFQWKTMVNKYKEIYDRTSLSNDRTDKQV